MHKASIIQLALLFALSFPALAQTAEKAKTCKSLPREECLTSKECALDYCPAAEGRDTPLPGCYVCRKRVHQCEVGFSHRDAAARKDECQNRPGCGMRVDCYCPCEDQEHPNYRKCVCQCTGGLPADCVEIGRMNR